MPFDVHRLYTCFVYHLTPVIFPGGAVYTRWGRSVCGIGASLVYTGLFRDDSTEYCFVMYLICLYNTLKYVKY